MSLRYAILGLLTYAPMNGYYLKTLFDSSVNNFWAANLSQIYRELGTLENEGHVSSAIQPQEDRPDKRIYTITADGRSAFQQWLTTSPNAFSSPKRDEFMLRVFFGSRLGKVELKRLFEEFLQRLTQAAETVSEPEIQTAMEKYSTALPVAEEALYWRFTIKRAQMTFETIVRWAEECIAELDESIAKEGDS